MPNPNRPRNRHFKNHGKVIFLNVFVKIDRKNKMAAVTYDRVMFIEMIHFISCTIF